MTVQQEHRTLTLPQQRTAQHDAPEPAPKPPVVRKPGAWVTREDQLFVRWMMVAMLVLGCYAALMVWLSARVW